MERVVLSEPELAALLCAVLIFGSWLSWRAQRARARWRGRRHNLRGQRGERAAERMLVKAGYLPLERQARSRYTVRVGAELHEVSLQADYLVERDGLRLVAEVKTGRNAPRFEHAETRRQLLEYQMAFGVPGVVLVDVEAQQLREVRFPLSGPHAPQHGRALRWMLVTTLTAAVACGLWGLLRS